MGSVFMAEIYYIGVPFSVHIYWSY